MDNLSQQKTVIDKSVGDKFVQRSDAALDKIIIESIGRNSMDITDLVHEFNIVETIFNPLVTGKVMITDAVGLMTKLPIMGKEKIKASVVRGKEYKVFEFYVVNITDMRKVTDTTTTYVLELVQSEYMTNVTTKISEAYSGNISSIVKDIYKNYFPYVSEQELHVDDTINIYKFVIPNWKPLKTVSWLTARALDNYSSPFIFYKTLYNGTHFRSMKSLVEQEPVDIFYRNAKNKKTTENEEQLGAASTQTVNEQKSSMDFFGIVEICNSGNRLFSGAYASTSNTIDIYQKEVNQYLFNYGSEFSKLPHLGGTPVSQNFVIDGGDVNGLYNTQNHAMLFSSSPFTSTEFTYNSNSLTMVPQRISFLETIQNFKYRFITSGRFDISAGSVVNIQLNEDRPYDQRETKSDTLDRIRSGNHIVVGIKHKFMQNRFYHLIIDVARDSTSEAL